MIQTLFTGSKTTPMDHRADRGDVDEPENRPAAKRLNRQFQQAASANGSVA
jgi:hypothetical protein